MLNLSSTTKNNYQGSTHQGNTHQGTNNQGNNNQGNNSNTKPSTYQIKFRPLGQSLELTFQELLTNKLITFPNTRDFEPQVKPSWQNDTHYCDYHRNKGHHTNNFLRLICLVQDLLDKGDIMVDGHKTNNDHEAFKNPLPNYDKGGASNNKGGPCINHLYDNAINLILVCDNQVNAITIKDK